MFFRSRQVDRDHSNRTGSVTADSLTLRRLLFLSCFGLACILQLSGGTPAWADDVEQLGRIADRLDALEAAGRFQELESVAKEYGLIAQRMQSPVHIAIGLRSLAAALRGQNKLADAENVCQQALRNVTQQRFTEKLQPVADKIALGLYLQLGQLLDTRGKYPESEASFLAGIKLGETKLGRASMELTPLLIDLAALYVRLARYDEATRLYDRAQSMIEAEDKPNLDLLTYVLHGRAVSHAYQHQYDEAVQLYKQELAMLEKLYGANHPYNADVQLALAQTYKAQRRLTEAVALLEKAMAIFSNAGDAQSIRLASAQLTLASILLEQGRFAEAESLYRRSLTTRIKILGQSHPSVAESMTELGGLYLYQDRDAEALPLLERALAINEQVNGRDARLTNVLTALVQVQRNLGQLDAAEATALRLMGIFEKSHPDSTYEALHLLATVYRAQRRYDDALKISERALAANEELAKRKGSSRLDTKRATILGSMALLYYDLRRLEDSAEMHRRSLELQEQVGVGPGEVAATLVRYAEVLYDLGRQQEALPLVERAIGLFEQQRTSFSGGDIERAAAFRKSSVIYEYAIRIQAQSQNMAAVFEAMERGQARSLLDQIATHGIDLFAGMPAETADRLRKNLDTVSVQLANVERRLETLQQKPDLPVADYRAQRDKLVAELRQRQGEYATVQADIRNVSPAYRLAVGQDHPVIDLATAQDYARRNKALLLRYFTGYGASYVLAIRPDGETSAHVLSTSASLAERLGIAQGSLNVEKLSSALANDAGSGVLQQLRGANTPQATEKVIAPLAALWELLVPEPLRASIAAGKIEQLIIIPDGPLAMLPFEALVVENDRKPTYLLDVGPPIVYAPSVTILHNLIARKASSAARGGAMVLSVGDPAYDQATADSATSAATRATTRSRYNSAGGQLKRLPYSALEVGWIAQVFEKQNIKVKKLLGQAATEAQVRADLANCTILHFACHGVVDPSYANLFGALALTPIKSSAADPKNDGYLTLGEIYGLALPHCELAILSACDTNFGPRQQGEGVWALSRGFLVAGSRRVVASNWYVDDQAAASLISYYGSLLAKPLGQGETPQYAAALHNAKRWVRQQEKWSSPCYWATFVMVGPN